MSFGKGIVIDFQQFKEKRENQPIEKSASFTEKDLDERDFRGRLHLTQEDAEMIVYCMGLGQEYFKIKAEAIADEGDQSQKELEMVNRLLGMMQQEILNPQGEGGYFFSLSFLELAFIIDCLEMTRNAVVNGINVFQAELGDQKKYIKWLDGTFFYLLDVYEKWRAYWDK